jgi:hypothetical protein
MGEELDTNLELNQHNLNSDNCDTEGGGIPPYTQQPQQALQQCTELIELSSEGLKIGSSIITPVGMEGLINRLLSNPIVQQVLKVQAKEEKRNGYVN